MNRPVSTVTSQRPFHAKPPVLGVTFGFYAPAGYFDSPQARLEVDRMVEIGVPWVCITPIIWQITANSTRMFADFDLTPGELELAEIIDYCHDQGLKVHLRPMIECFDGHGRTEIDFPKDLSTRIPGRSSGQFAAWFASMRSRTRAYAKLARKTGCEMYGIDSEIDRFVHMTPSWREVVQVAREQYDGIVTSSHTHRVDFEKQLGEQDHWFRDLDVLGTSFYKPSTDRAEASVADRVAFLRPAVESYRRIAELLGRPIMFGEMGCTACTGAGQHPASWHGGASYDGQEQARHTEAVLESFWNEPWWAGCFWWKWDEHLDRPHYRDDPAGDKGFTIYGKPAAQTLGAWFAKSRA